MLTVYHEELNEGVIVGVRMGTSDIYEYIWHKNWVNIKHNKNGAGQKKCFSKLPLSALSTCRM